MSERRYNLNTEIRKVEAEDEKMVLEGKAVAFDSPETYYGETEIIDPHALDECDMSDVVLRYNHNDNQYTLARTRNKSLELEIKEDGLYFKAELIPTQTNKDAYLMVQSGLLDKCSFAFTIEDWEYNESTRTTTIKKINKMYDVAVVDFPFYNDTSVEARDVNCLFHSDLKAKIDEIKADIERKERKALIDRLEREALLERLK